METKNSTKINSRGPKFSKDEEKALVDAIMPHYDILFGAHSMTVTNEKKNAIWAAVAETVSFYSCLAI